MKGAVGGGTKATRRLPVFVSPEELEFVGEEETSHKQILTIFNPYNFTIRFKGVICMCTFEHTSVQTASNGVAMKCGVL